MTPAHVWTDDPSPVLAAVFGAILQQRMQGLPILNPALRVEPVAFRRDADGHWSGTMITPWAINLLRLPGTGHWPTVCIGGRHEWAYASGTYEFTVAAAAGLGSYHLCSLFSPAFAFSDHQQAYLTALATMQALGEMPRPAPPVTDAALPDRRSFLGLRR